MIAELAQINFEMRSNFLDLAAEVSFILFLLKKAVEQRRRFALPRCPLGAHIYGWMEAGCFWDYFSPNE